MGDLERDLGRRPPRGGRAGLRRRFPGGERRRNRGGEFLLPPGPTPHPPRFGGPRRFITGDIRRIGGLDFGISTGAAVIS